LALGWLGDQVQKIVAGAKTGECRVLAAVQQLKPQHPVKSDSSPHVVGGEVTALMASIIAIASLVVTSPDH
jgi:hypothetical protein